jgi:hypothetical protein
VGNSILKAPFDANPTTLSECLAARAFELSDLLGVPTSPCERREQDRQLLVAA